LGKIGYCYFK